ncbi:MAG: glycosyltransferase [Methanomicrobiales archaeon]|nr:glycosyltransferase [Methanomicrobiales archaeon]
MPEVGTGKVIPAGSPLPDRTVQGLISIILATYDERENIRKSIETIFSIIPAPVEVIVVDDDSPDGTWKVVEEMADPRVVLVRRTRTRGLASAIVRGIVESRGSIVCWWDADMPKCVERVPDMLSALETADVVVGSRYAEGGSDERDPVRVLTSKVLNGMATLVLGYGIRDYDSGVVVLRRRVFDYALPEPSGFGEYFIGFIYTCCRKGLRVVEVPYTLTERDRGISKSSPSLLRFLRLGVSYSMAIWKARLFPGD